ncbi:hypothetical protein PT974_02950 [Cladobotryum mycophilum]|uniref:Uncharacterized protein n=1 Tax=Cladobotryum mycophilum TaxID=491253 RepID=A0ABR0SZK3_9HYPO
MKIQFAAIVAVVAQKVFADCTAQKRLDILESITTAFNAPSLTESAALINALPFQDNCLAPVSVNGSPYIEGGFDGPTSKVFSIAVRQVFAHVEATGTDYGNGTTLYDAYVSLGLYSIRSPVMIRAYVPVEFNLTTCEIMTLPTHTTVPYSIAGVRVYPPMFPTLSVLPTIVGVDTIPGLGAFIHALAAQGFGGL